MRAGTSRVDWSSTFWRFKKYWHIAADQVLKLSCLTVCARQNFNFQLIIGTLTNYYFLLWKYCYGYEKSTGTPILILVMLYINPPRMFSKNAPILFKRNLFSRLRTFTLVTRKRNMQPETYYLLLTYLLLTIYPFFFKEQSPKRKLEIKNILIFCCAPKTSKKMYDKESFLALKIQERHSSSVQAPKTFL